MTRLWGGVALALAITAAGCAAPAGGPSDRGWTTFAELHGPRAFAQAVVLPTGEILVVGGLDPNASQLVSSRSELVDPLSRRVTQLPQLLLGRVHQTASLTSGERVVVAGGVERLGDAWSPVDRVDVYDVATQRWHLGAPLLEARSDHAAVTLADGRVLVIGGNQGTRPLASVEAYDPASDAWSYLSPLPRPRTQHTAVRLADGRVLVAGGIDSDGGATDTTFLYDPARDAWSDGPRMDIPRIQHVAVALPDGNVLFAGGDGAASGTSELYLAREDRFVPSGTLVDPRLVAQAAALPDGRVVLTGGLPPRMERFTPLRSTEVWSPADRTWRALPPAPSARAWGSLVFSSDALYLVSGSGLDETAFAAVDRLTLE